MPQSQSAAWRKSSRSGQEGQCVEVADLDQVAVRDSKSPSGPVLAFSRREWRSFVDHVKAGRHDL
ncbi:MAG: DUF397 domain-containing protein [Actinomadura sp.]